MLGALIGAWHGFWVAYVGIPAFIVTLSSMLLFRGLTLVVLEGATVGGLPEDFKEIGNGFLPEIGPDTDLPQPDDGARRSLVVGALVVPRVPQARGVAAATTSRSCPSRCSSSSWSSSAS